MEKGKRREMKDRIKRIIAFLLAVIIFWQVIPADIMETFATQDFNLRVTLKDNGVSVSEATVVAKNDATDEVLEFTFDEGEGKYVSNEPIVSENGFSYTFTFTYEGVYEKVEKQMVFDYPNETLEFAYEEMEKHRLYAVDGMVKRVFNDSDMMLEGVTVKAYKGMTATDNAWVDTVTTDSSGQYRLYLTKGI